VLAILASKLNASEVLAIDIDNWAYENSIENCARNNCSNITVMEGNASLLTTQQFDVIFANINRNILLNDIKTYTKVLNTGGLLMMSGFYTEDLKSIIEETQKYSLLFKTSDTMNNWVVALFVKK
jgi:ribosomal protein L11 methyltransferase